jgi:uroporphyrinogen decarboxylase
MNGRQRFLAACRLEPVDATPVWFMRQAGGRLPDYLELRERYSVMDIATTPELCARVSAGAAETLGTDGAVMYADIMLVAVALGLEVELTSAGPVLGSVVRGMADIDRLGPVDPVADLGHVLSAITMVRQRLADRAAVIGSCGGPFTLGAYLVEGAPSRDQVVARSMIHAAPATWHALMERLTVATIDYVRAQVSAGADAIAVFDTWAATLTETEYRAAVLPYSSRIVAAVGQAGVPSIHSVARSRPLLRAIQDLGPTVAAIDSRQSIDRAMERLGPIQSIQGNLDPALVLAGWEHVEAGTRDVLVRVAGRPGHIFNLGEAAPRDADPGILRDLAALVHEATTHHRDIHEAPYRPLEGSTYG